jgi:hypothetical protein
MDDAQSGADLDGQFPSLWAVGSRVSYRILGERVEARRWPPRPLRLKRPRNPTRDVASAGQQNVQMPDTVPTLRSVVLDTTDARGLAEFYRQLLGYEYRPGDEPPGPEAPDPAGQDWLVLVDSAGKTRLAFQQVKQLASSTWPGPTVRPILAVHCPRSAPSVRDLHCRAADRARHEGPLLAETGLKQSPWLSLAHECRHVQDVVGPLAHRRVQYK